MTIENRRIVVVDDNRAIHDDLRKLLGPRPPISELEAQLFGADPSPAVHFELTSAYQGADGIELVRAARAAGQPFALAIVDMRMPPGIDGMDTVAGMWEVDPDLQVVICTAYSDTSWQDLVARFGTTDRLLILKKPFDLAAVCQLALALTEKWALAAKARSQLADLARSRAELAASLALARAVQEATSDGLLVVDAERQVVVANRAFCTMWRVSPDALASGDSRALLDSAAEQLADRAGALARVRYFYDRPEESGADELRLKDGRVLERWTGPVRAQGDKLHGRMWWFRDVTERRRFELERNAVTERLASMGRIAAGVGHEINNPLTYAVANVDRLLDTCASGPPPTAELVDSLRQVRDGLARIRVIVRDLQTAARGDETHGPLELRPLLEQAIQLASAEVRHRAPIVRRYDAVSPVLGNATRLGQVFLNLIVNAAQAIPDGQAGHHRIEIALRDVGDAAVIEVTDTGSGIAPEHLDRIFDPFFTTKDVGSGTGLGLAISREIVVGHRGTLTVKSALGQGTTMTVTLPHAPRAARPQTPTPAATPPSPPPCSRRGKVLVIDDEPFITRVLQKGLTRHDVVVASQARDALDRIDRGETFDVILCDLMMPDLSGIDVHELLMRDHPAVAARIVFMTGGAFTAKAKQFLSTVKNPRIDKPFSLAQVAQLVDRQVEAAAPAAPAAPAAM